ncbi:MAG: beta-galactosidase [Dysgonamonadaceae bacterium]|jgi:beta-galactosidase/beta-glucuronidase|nr:beta-galactosidase [Dysgonamonadaceae bacterium]
MKHSLFFFYFLFVTGSSLYSQWKPAGDRIKTVWGENLDPNNVLPEYPRPILERKEWLNLNGLWDLSIRPVEQGEPNEYEDRILVPFPVESSLSGLAKRIDDKHALWYRRTFTIPAAWKNHDVILNFGAADWKTEVFINGIKICTHTGGYTPFGINITPFLVRGEQTLTVKIWDPTDKYFQPRGKQVNEPANIVYTPISGIWQTVWLEPVGSRHIVSLKTLPDVDKSVVSVTVGVNTPSAGASDYAEVKIYDGKKLLSTTRSIISEPLTIPVADAKLWSPDSPHLYDMEITLYSDGRQTDMVKSYFAMRKISIRSDKENGYMRIQLNNRDIVQYGLLDQGYWPDGLYTAPTDEALKFDIEKAKELGYNMLRKHIKTEPARWYTWCDRLGMLVWQDMPSGDNNWRGDRERSPYIDTNIEHKPNPAQENFFKEWKEIIDYLYSYPSIVMWIPFNEGWGQFRTKEVSDFTKQYDPSRILNTATGGNFSRDGDVLDMHTYPEPKAILFDPTRPNLIGEFGGICYVARGHLWQDDNNFGYIEFKTPKEATDKYEEYADMLKKLIRKGFCGAVYTQITDVEIEANGIMSYDRKMIKLDADRLKKINREICNMLQ